MASRLADGAGLGGRRGVSHGCLWHGIALGRPFALVILDACMPVTSGLSLAAMIRDGPSCPPPASSCCPRGNPPATGRGPASCTSMPNCSSRSRRTSYLVPIYRVMSRTNEATPPVRETVVAPSLSVAPLRILVAEDNEFNRRHLERLLARRSYDVRLAANGREALALLGVDGQGAGVRSPETVTDGRTSLSSPTPDARPLTMDFDLMLLDLHMPQLDGFQVIRAIREREQAAGGHLPVIALTAHSRQEDRESCLAAGMDEYLSKPIRAAEMFATIDRVVADRGVSAPHQAEIADGASLLDPVVLLASCGDDEEGCAGYARISGSMRRPDSPKWATHSESRTRRGCVRPRTNSAVCSRCSPLWPVMRRRISKIRRRSAGSMGPSPW